MVELIKFTVKSSQFMFNDTLVRGFEKSKTFELWDMSNLLREEEGKESEIFGSTMKDRKVKFTVRH